VYFRLFGVNCSKDYWVEKAGEISEKIFNQKRSTGGKVVQSCVFFLQFFAEFCKPLRFFCKFLQFFAILHTPLRI
jgi:hypothetical protein